MIRYWLITLAVTGACHGAPDQLALPLEVTGDAVRVAGDGQTSAPLDLGSMRAYAIDDGRAIELAIELHSGGATVERAAPGPVYLSYDDTWFVTGGASIDLSTVSLGRADFERTGGEPVPLAIAVDGLAPWSDGDQLQLYARDPALWSLTPLALEPGATAIDAAFDYRGPLATTGDALWVGQLEARVLGDDVYAGLGRAAIAEVDMTAADATVAASLAPAPERSFELDWNIRAFDDVRLEAQAVIARSWYDANLATLDGAGEHGFFDLAADLVTMRVTDQTGRNISGALAYGDPFPASWDDMATFIAWYPVAIRAADGDAAVTVFDTLWLRDRAEVLDGAPIAPGLGPPQSISVRGGDAPSVSWSPPALGQATLYQVTVLSVRSRDGASELIGQAEIVTEMTGMHLPPGVVTAGADAFAVQIAAIAGPAGHGAAPRRLSLPYAVASITSTLARP